MCVYVFIAVLVQTFIQLLSHKPFYIARIYFIDRYGREDEEVMGLKFCNEAVMCLAQLYPPHAGSQPPEANTPLQVSCCEACKDKGRKTI